MCASPTSTNAALTKLLIAVVIRSWPTKSNKYQLEVEPDQDKESKISALKTIIIDVSNVACTPFLTPRQHAQFGANPYTAMSYESYGQCLNNFLISKE
jgi:hypothetical protein